MTTAENAPLTLMSRLALALFLTYLAVALPLAVIPTYVTQWPGYNTTLAGLCVGFSFLATLFTRGLAGRFSDQYGGDVSMHRGLLYFALGCAVCAFSGLSALPLPPRFASLLAGRLIIGVGESYTVVGIHVWGIALVGQHRAGRVLSFTGMAMYGAYAIGGPTGLWFYSAHGFTALMLICLCLPGAGYLVSRNIPHVAPRATSRRAILAMIYIVRWHGFGVALQGVGFSIVGAYIAVAFSHFHWSYGSWGLTCFGTAFVGVRFVVGGAADRYGGLRVALVSLMVETLGLACIAMAHAPYTALCGAFLTGAGCAMVYPALGQDVVRIVPQENRAIALGGFAAFQDLAYAVTAPLAGSLADWRGYSTVFCAGAFCAASAAVIVATLLAVARRGPMGQTIPTRSS